ncbi:hypothetical protein M427DRAFT_473078 [Gonapodya prolifera JEL478]|uniref:Uncharacterized protein n=1 Tax=Gonapodya prolifera (strain JEL478) TaxID=1344416 RepID=A0A139AR92_GONPJ|nr:hypothetical protein M427DRAFT_473078 [Gonapodya prolifera JEL478]|eukprot:KXS19270.1 hypothetical protein M427DRAFT_473078 [Gonapodya prolifera JEL478]
MPAYCPYNSSSSSSYSLILMNHGNRILWSRLVRPPPPPGLLPPRPTFVPTDATRHTTGLDIVSPQPSWRPSPVSLPQQGPQHPQVMPHAPLQHIRLASPPPLNPSAEYGDLPDRPAPPPPMHPPPPRPGTPYVQSPLPPSPTLMQPGHPLVRPPPPPGLRSRLAFAPADPTRQITGIDV